MSRFRWQAMILTIVLAACTAPSWAQSVDPALQKAAEARVAATSAGDADTYGRFTLEDAVFTDATGLTETRASRMKAVQGNPVKIPKPKVSDEKYRMFGDTAIRTWRQDELSAEGQNLSTRRIQVWVKQKGEWRLASVQFTGIPAIAQSVDPTLQKAIDDRRSARAAKDGVNWSRATADDFLSVHSDGRVHAKQEEVAEIKAGTAQPATPPTDVRVRTYGSTSVYTAQLHFVDGPRRVTEVWVKPANGQWQVVSSHLTTITK